MREWFVMIQNKINIDMRTSMGEFLQLEGSIGAVSDLIVIKTSEKKYESKVEFIINQKDWMNNSNFTHFRNCLIDLSIVVFLDHKRFKTQDCDNIAKVILDSLKKLDNSTPYLFENDKQVVRLLVYKLEAKQYPGYRTNQVVISFREHDPDKQMILQKITTL